MNSKIGISERFEKCAEMDDYSRQEPSMVLPESFRVDVLCCVALRCVALCCGRDMCGRSECCVLRRITL